MFTWSLCFLRQYTSQTEYNSTFIFSDNLGKHFKFRILQLIMFSYPGLLIFGTHIKCEEKTKNIGSNKAANHLHIFYLTHDLLEKVSPCPWKQVTKQITYERINRGSKKGHPRALPTSAAHSEELQVKGLSPQLIYYFT